MIPRLVLGQVPITSITTPVNVSVTSGVNYTGVGASGGDYSAINLSYNWGTNTTTTANLKRVDGFVTASNNFVFLNNINSIVKIRRNNNANVSGIRSLIYAERNAATTPSNGTLNPFPVNLLPSYEDDMEKVFDARNYNLGTDNIFDNTATNNKNNIERLDVIFLSGIATPNLNDVGFAVFDRGTGDAFKIAAITAIDPATQTPTSFGNLVNVTTPASQFSAGGLLGGDFNYGILRKEQAEARLLLSGIGAQNIRGTLITLNSLGVTAGQVIYGYALFGGDVVSGTHTLTNFSSFPTTTGGLAGGLDMVGITGVSKTNSASVVVIPIDSDQDGVINAIDVDDDNDGILDTNEGNGTDPSADFDNDGTPNYLDISYVTAPSWALTDANNDGIVDFFDQDLDGVANHLDLDSDNDGIADVVEASANNANADPDGDGRVIALGSTSVASNGLASSLGGTPITPVNTDADSVADYLDLDSDNDGIADVIEVGGIDGDNDGRISTGNIADFDADGWSDIADADDPSPTIGVAIHAGNGDDNQDGGGNGTDTIPNYRDLDSDNDG
ncbi:MAG: hypothetical protein MUE85_13425, partial [Microscillaceae bacterium]|nr:hypothetical protein [Microscillaceae bacterium]